MFRDEIENLLYNISDFEKGARNKTINSRGRARILDANSRETFRDREFSPMSGLNFEMELRDGLLEQRFGQCDRFVCV